MSATRSAASHSDESAVAPAKCARLRPIPASPPWRSGPSFSSLPSSSALHISSNVRASSRLSRWSSTCATPCSPSRNPIPGPRLRVHRPAHEPLLVLGIAPRAGRGERVEHTRCAVRDVQPAAGIELVDVAGEEAIVALRSGALEDRLRHRVARSTPAARGRLERGRSRGARRRPGRVACACAAVIVATASLEELRRTGKISAISSARSPRLGGVEHQEVGEGQKREQAQACQRVAVDVVARAARGARKPGSAIVWPRSSPSCHAVSRSISAIRPSGRISTLLG